MPKPLMVKDTDVVYIALLKTTSLYILFANKSHRPPRQYFTFSDSRPTAKSNTIFDKITLMALEKYSLEIDENLDFAPVWADVMRSSNSSLFSSPRFPKREMENRLQQ